MSKINSNDLIKPGFALWRQEIGDIPVLVIKKLGTYNEKIYYEIEGLDKNFTGRTGVPHDELIQK